MVVRVLVTDRVPELGGAGVVTVPQVRRHETCLTGRDVRHRRAQRRDHRSGLGRGREMDGGLRQGEPRLRHPMSCTACAAAVAVCSAVGSAMPMSSLACTTSRRAMNRGSSPAVIIRAR